MARKEFHKVYQDQGGSGKSALFSLTRLSAYNVMVGIVSLGALALLLEFAFLSGGGVTVDRYLQLEVEEGADLYPEEIMASELAHNVDEADLVHLSLLHEACLNHKDSVIPWTYGLGGKVASPSVLINRDDPNLIDKIRQCPDVDLFLPVGIRGHGYCEDSIAYTKFLKTRMLPAWAVEMKYLDKKTGKTLTYHELCPKTPMIFFNHYWDGIPNSPDWPLKKPLYLMANIEMYELQAKHYWGVDAVLCKTAICARRVRLWYEQEGNPRNTKVFYTRHTSSDVATFAKHQLGADAIEPKNFSDVSFIHAVGTSVQKGTRPVLDCWLKRPDFPKLTIYMHPDVYSDEMRATYDERIKKSQVKIELGRIDANEFGKIIAEASFFLCTSLHEGYGHYINQARASAAVIVTTDVPPMNEFLTPSSGILVHSTRRIFKQQILGGGYMGEYGLKNVPGLTAQFGGRDVCEAVERVMKMTPEERETMAERAKKQYFVDMNFFAHKMDELRAVSIYNKRDDEEETEKKNTAMFFGREAAEHSSCSLQMLKIHSNLDSVGSHSANTIPLTALILSKKGEIRRHHASQDGITQDELVEYAWLKFKKRIDVERTLLFVKEYQEKALSAEFLLEHARTLCSVFMSKMRWFKKHYGIKRIIRHGEAASVDLGSLPSHRKDLAEIIEEFDSRNVLNFVNTALYYRLLPSQTLATKSFAGHKKGTTKVLVSLCCNMDGSEKLDFVVINKSVSPRCFKGVNIKNLPLHDFWNKTA